MHLTQQLHNLCTHLIQIRINLGQIPWRLIYIEMAVERDLIPDNTDLTIFVIPLAGVDPGFRYMGQ